MRHVVMILWLRRFSFVAAILSSMLLTMWALKSSLPSGMTSADALAGMFLCTAILPLAVLIVGERMSLSRCIACVAGGLAAAGYIFLRVLGFF
jgi:hypothetical protein